MPAAPWAVVRGRWNAADGVLHGSQQGGDRIGAAIRVPLNITDCDILYKLQCPLDASHILRIQSCQKEIIFLVYVSPRHLSIVRQQTGVVGTTGKVVLAEDKVGLVPGEWCDIRVQLLNDEIAVQVGETVVRAKNETLTGIKRVMALMVNGGGAAFKDLSIYSSDAKQADAP
jgi:hypothetical protein